MKLKTLIIYLNLVILTLASCSKQREMNITINPSLLAGAVVIATVPSAPIIGTATAGNTQATISFSAPLSDGGATITSYTVTSNPGNLTATGSATSLIVTGLTNGLAYTFTVIATNSVGGSAASAASNSATPSNVLSVPGAPTALSATTGNMKASVTFSAPASNGGAAISSYTVTSNPGSLTATGSASPLTVTGLTNGVSYTFTAKATNSQGSSLASAASGAVTVAPVTSTLAGSSSGYVEGLGTIAKFQSPTGISVDSVGNVFVADLSNYSIRKITSLGLVSTLAGTGAYGNINANGALASFTAPSGIVVASSGNVFVSDIWGGGNSDNIRQITPAADVTVFSGMSTVGLINGAAGVAQFNTPTGLAIDSSNNIYVADFGNNVIRKVTAAGVASTFAGTGAGGAIDGAGASATFFNPHSVAVDSVGNVYVADYGNNLIRKITSLGVVSTLAGSTAGYVDGTGTGAKFFNPRGVAVDTTGNVYVADTGNNAIRMITPAGVVTTLAGSLAGTAGAANGIGTAATFNGPRGIAVDSSGNLYISDTANFLVRKIQ